MIRVYPAARRALAKDVPKVVKGLFAAFVALFALAVSSGASAVSILPVEMIASGMRATGYTVVEGVTIEPFDVEILGVLKGGGPAGDLILVRVGGDAIDRAGGIAAGMSGSPVYIDDKLVGAVGYGFAETDGRIGLLTPASDMLAVLERIPESAPGGQETGGEEGGEAVEEGGEAALPFSRVAFAASSGEAERLRRMLPADVGVAVPVATPLVISGLGTRAREALIGAVPGRHLQPVTGGGMAGIEGIAAPLQPGSALGVQLMDGDIDVTAIGTVTAVEGDRFIAFGHPLLHRGDVEFIVSEAYILRTIPSSSMSFKLGVPLAPVGLLLEDRGAAIGGRLGREAELVDVAFHVVDTDHGVEKALRTQVVHDPSLTPGLVAAASLEAIDRALDGIGQGTSRVRFRVSGDGLPRPLERDNLHFSSLDVAAASIWELQDAVRLLQMNEFSDVRLRRIEMDVEVEKERKTARIEEAEVEEKVATIGSTVEVEVTVRPFRREPVSYWVPVEIPEDLQEGRVTLSVYGGYSAYGAVPAEETGTDGAEPEGEEEPAPDGEGDASATLRAESLEKLIDEFESHPRNHEIVVEYYPNRKRKSDEDSDEDRGFDRFEPVQPIRSVLATEYLLEGEALVTLELVGTESPPPAEEEPEPFVPEGPELPGAPRRYRPISRM